MKILSVDPGEKRIGIAITDPDGTIALPMEIINHISRELDAKKIARLAEENQVGLLIFGIALDTDGNLTPSARKSQRLADAVREFTSINIEMVDEYGSTNVVQQAAVEMGLNRKQRRSHRDDIAALVILQNYLETHRSENIGDS